MQSLDLLSRMKRKADLRQAILRRAPGISSEQVDFICNSVNINRCYFIKSTTNREKFMNLVTREMIITDEIRSFTEILPIYGRFKSPYFEKTGSARRSASGSIDPTFPAAAVKMRVGIDNGYTSVTYSLILYMAKYDI